VSAASGRRNDQLAVAFWRAPRPGAPTVASVQGGAPTLLGTAEVRGDGSFDFDFPRLGTDQQLIVAVVVRGAPPAKVENGAYVAPERYDPAGTADIEVAGALSGTTSTPTPTPVPIATATPIFPDEKALAQLTDVERTAYLQCRSSAEASSYPKTPTRILDVNAVALANGTVVDTATGPAVVFVRISSDRVEGAILDLFNPQALYCLATPAGRSGLLLVQRACGAALVMTGASSGSLTIRDMPCRNMDDKGDASTDPIPGE
jgi:hypothetical protein